MLPAVSAYARMARTGLAGRALEAALLLQAARAIEKAFSEDAGDGAGRRRALLDNQFLWTLLATDGTEPDSPLPQRIKDDIAAVGALVFRQTKSCLLGAEREAAAVLVRVNRSLADGLSAPPATEVRTQPGAARA